MENLPEVDGGNRREPDRVLSATYPRNFLKVFSQPTSQVLKIAGREKTNHWDQRYSREVDFAKRTFPQLWGRPSLLPPDSDSTTEVSSADTGLVFAKAGALSGGSPGNPVMCVL